MAAPQASSRLELLQARFQQKQLQEKEQKLLQLYDQQQQRAYQVVQRGSAGSNGSNHATSISHHTVTRTSSSSHTTSTSQGGKVRQMFDERRQTSVKGIDRSYPLEPLENKPRKQANGNTVQKNGNLTVNRQSVTVKRVARADVNSNLNGGKPIVSYHEEISRESFGPSASQNQDDDEFGNENHVAQYANGNHRDETHIEEVLNEDTRERNRMMAKLHLMEYDETLKNRVKNDLESEEFPENFMVDVPDKLPKQNVTKKLSQAEIRLERFKNANAKRGNGITRNPTTVSKKRSDPIFPAKSTSRGDPMVKSRTREVLDRRSSSREKSSGSRRSKAGAAVSESVEETMSSSDSERNVRRRDESPRFFCRESERSATTCAIDSKTAGKLSSETLTSGTRRSESPRSFCKESGKSATAYAINAKAAKKLSPEPTKDRARRRSESPKFFCKESERSATTYAIDSKNIKRLSPELSKVRIERSASPKFFCEESEKSATTYAIDPKTTKRLSPELSKIRVGRSESPKFFCKESEKSATTYAIDSKNIKRLSPELSKVKIERSASPKFFCEESEKSATTYAIDPKTTKRLSPVLSNIRVGRSESPKFFCKESEKSATTYAIDSKTARRLSSDTPKGVKKRSDSPKFFCKESEKSATTYAIDSKTVNKLSSELSKGIKKRSESPKFFCKETEKSATAPAIDSKTVNKLTSDCSGVRKPDVQSEKFITVCSTDSRSRSTSPDYMKDTESFLQKIEPKHRKDTLNDITKESIGIDTIDRDIKSSKREIISRSFSPKDLKHDVINHTKKPKSVANKPSNVYERLRRERSSSPQFFCLEGKKSATTMNIGTRDAKIASKSPDFNERSIKKRSESPRISSQRNNASIVRTGGTSKSPDFTKKSFRKSNTSPQFFPSDSERSATIMMVTPETIAKPKTELATAKKREQGVFTSTVPITNTINTKPQKETLEESNEDSSRRFIRNSVSRFFSEQYENALREADVDTRTSVRSPENRKSLRSSRGSSPLSLKDLETPGSRFHDRSDRSIDGGSGRASSFRSRKIVDSREETPEFYCYETEKSATTVSLKPKPPRSIAKIPPKSPSPKPSPRTAVRGVARETLRDSRSPTTSDPKNRSSKSPDNLTAVVKDTKALERRGSASVLRSTKLIRDAMKRQNDTNQRDYATGKRGKGSRSSSVGSVRATGISSDSKRRSWEEEARKEVEVNGKVDGRAETPIARQLPVVESSSKSCTSTGVDTENRGITVPGDRYVKQGRPGGTYSRYANKTSTGGGKEKLFTYSVQRPSKKRGSLFEPNVFERSGRDYREAWDSSEEKTVAGSKLVARNATDSPSPTSEAAVRGLKRRTDEDTAGGGGERKILRSREQTPSPILLKGTRTSVGEITVYDETNKGKHGKDTWRGGATSRKESIIRHSKRRAEESTVNRRIEAKVSKSREQTPSPTQRRERKVSSKGTIPDGSKRRRTPSPQTSRQTQILRSMELVRLAMKGSNVEKTRASRNTVREAVSGNTVEQRHAEIVRRSGSALSTTIVIGVPESNALSVKEKTLSGKNYERTDSVESALKRFDSIGTEADSESIRNTLARSKESITERRRTKSGDTEGSAISSRTISLKALDRPDVNPSGSPESRPSSRSSSRRTSMSVENVEAFCRRGTSKKREPEGEKKFAKARDSIEIARIAIRANSPACKRKLFLGADSGDEAETGSSRSRCSPDSVARTVTRVSPSFDKSNASGRVKTVSGRRLEASSTGMRDKRGADGTTSTGAGDRSLSVKQLRSIEDIRKSIEGESSPRKRREPASRKSAIANNASGRSSGGARAAGRSEARRINIDDRAGNRKEASLPGRPGNVAARHDALGNTNRSSVKCAMRFSRVVKSPSPEATKTPETGSRARRNVPMSPSKSPDIVARRLSTELKAQDAKSTKRPTPAKGAEPIGNRKTTTTTTTTTTMNTGTRKSTDVVDGAILENGLHLRDQTAETKYDNDSPATKKSDAFVIDFDEQPPKENDAPLPRKPLLRKQSTEKQIHSTQSVRPPSSVSSTSNGSSMQGQTSNPRSRMTSKGRTSVSGSVTHKGSTGSKSGGCAATVESLIPCKICGRRFAQDRVTLHEQICAKTGQKKRKQFDTVMYRVRGTDLEPFVKKGICKKQPEKLKKPEVKSNWRRKHEDFINAIRSAKQVQAHLAAGGKLSDLPPPPVTDNYDYIQCPHCGRKFNQAAAERHIPKCEHMLHNKPIHTRAPKPKR